jgi:hypothetical protein
VGGGGWRRGGHGLTAGVGDDDRAEGQRAQEAAAATTTRPAALLGDAADDRKPGGDADKNDKKFEPAPAPCPASVAS